MFPELAPDACLDADQTYLLASAIAEVRRKAAVYRRWSTSGHMAPAMAYALLEDDIFENGLALEATELLALPEWQRC